MTITTLDKNSVDMDEFVHINGHRPRGEGYWIFDLGRNGAWTQTAYYGSYSLALARALIEAGQRGCETVRVSHKI